MEKKKIKYISLFASFLLFLAIFVNCNESKVYARDEYHNAYDYYQTYGSDSCTVGDIQHHYDVVIGPVADDNTMETVQLYLSDILSVDEAVTRLRYNKVNNQVSFHTPLALEHLILESRKDV